MARRIVIRPAWRLVCAQGFRSGQLSAQQHKTSECGCRSGWGLDDFFSDSSGEYQDLYKEYSGSGNVKRVNVEGRFDALLNYFLETFDEFLKATDDDGLRMEEISEVS